MGYYIRVFGTENPSIAIEKFRDCSKGAISIEEGTDQAWISLIVRDSNNREIILIEKDVVGKGDFAKEEIEEFKEELKDSKPTSGAMWVINFLDSVKVTYALQILSAVDNDENWSTVGALNDLIRRETKGIIHAGDEGFSNQEGYHIVWEFSENASGNWWMAIRGNNDDWTKFEMDLGNPQQRKQFLNGEVPRGVRLI